MLQNTKPAGISGGYRQLVVSNWKAFEKNTLRGFFSLTLPSGMIVHNCALHEKGSARWIGLPTRQYRKEDGAVAYSPVIDFAGTAERNRFQAAAMEALEEFQAVRDE
jgi:DNA-binding cell septation regulator SpoVG